MARTSLSPGFRFHPTDTELVLYYLKRKVLNKPLIGAIGEVELYKFSPWDLPDKSLLRSRDREWYFFCPRDRKYANGPRTNRATETGYWKTTGRDRAICNGFQTVGMRKTLIFHLGRAPQGKRTDWVMHEYRLEIKDLFDSGIPQDSYVLCKLYEKSGPGPKNGEQHGAPFKEEEWEDGLDDNSLEPLPCVDNGSPSFSLVDENKTVIDSKKLFLEKKGESSLQSPCQNGSVENISLLNKLDTDSIIALLGDENDLCHSGNDNNEMPKLSNYDCNVEAVSDGNDIFYGLEDLNTRGKLFGSDNCDLTKLESNHVTCQTLPRDGYLELVDFDSPLKYPMDGNGPEVIQCDSYGSRLESENGDKLGLRNNPLSWEKASSLRLNDRDSPSTYSLEMSPVNILSGDQFSCDNYDYLGGPLNHEYHLEGLPLSGGNDIFNGLENLNTIAKRSEIDNCNPTSMGKNNFLGQTLPGDGYLELVDFESPMKYAEEGDGPVDFGSRLEGESGDRIALRNPLLKEIVPSADLFGYGNYNNLGVYFSPHSSLEVVHSASGLDSSRSTLLKKSGVFADNLNGNSNYFQDHVGFGRTSVSGCEDANQTLRILLGGNGEIANTKSLQTLARGSFHTT